MNLGKYNRIKMKERTAEHMFFFLELLHRHKHDHMVYSVPYTADKIPEIQPCLCDRYDINKSYFSYYAVVIKPILSH